MLHKVLFESRLLGIAYRPQPENQLIVDRAQYDEDDEIIIGASVLDNQESHRFFGVPLGRRGIQPVWLMIKNKGQHPYRLHLGSVDPNYYSPLEAAYVCHFDTGRRLAGFGILSWLFFPLLFIAPFKFLGARLANQRMNALFQEQGIGWGLIRPGLELSGFIFTTVDQGTKDFTVKLLGPAGVRQFQFSIPVKGLRLDREQKEFHEYYSSSEKLECDEVELRNRLERLPRCSTNKHGSIEGDPLNLVVIGDFQTALNAFGARWDETEAIDIRSCWRTVKSFLFGTRYRYCPVSPLYFQGRVQDFALQRTREKINERLHLRLWLTPLVFSGKPVWVGQISRDIGVRFTPRTWNLSTHKIDPDVDEARDYVMGDLIDAGRVSHVGYVSGVQMANRNAPRKNLTGDTYFTDGLRAVLVTSESRTNPQLFDWS